MKFTNDLAQSLLALATICVESLSDLEDIKAMMAELNSVIPFDCAVIAIDTELNFSLKDQQQVILYNMTPEWADLYFERGYYKIDPILKTVSNTPSVVHWREVYAAAPTENLDFKKISKEYVGDNGLTVLKKSEQGSTLISLVMPGDADGKEWAPILEYIAPHIHEIFNREGEFQRRSLWRPQLTERELEVLEWVKEGKSNWDISKLLSISERTVKFHLSNIFEKLSVVNRSQSIAKAIHYGYISS